MTRLIRHCRNLLLLGMLLLTPVSGWAYALRESYVPPDVAYAQDLSQRVQVSDQFNLNTMNWVELKGIPGLSEDMALKIMRNRPFSDIRDFYRRMPGVSGKQLNLWVQQLQPRLRF